MFWSIKWQDGYEEVVDENDQIVCSNMGYYPNSVCINDQMEIVHSVNAVRTLNKLLENNRCTISIDGEIITNLSNLRGRFQI